MVGSLLVVEFSLRSRSAFVSNHRRRRRSYRTNFPMIKDAPSPVATAAPQGAKVFAGRVNPPPLTDSVGPLSELALLTRLESRNKTTTRPSDANMRNWSCGSSSCTEIDGSELNMGLSKGSRKRNLAYKGSLLYSAFLSRKLDGKNLPRRLHKPPHDSARISEISNVKGPVANNPDEAARPYSSHLRVHWPLFGNQRKKPLFGCLKCFPYYIHRHGVLLC
nr:hypothetical protein B296_00042562 [Ipomoea batatas]